MKILVLWCAFLTGVLSQLITMRVRNGDEANLPCWIPEADAVGSKVRWYKDDTEWLSSGTYILMHKTRLRINKPAPNEWNLQIRNIDRGFAAVYKCKLENAVRKTIRVIVETKPDIDADRSSQTSISVPEGQTTAIECVVNGEPTPEIKWYRITPGSQPRETFTRVTGRSITLPVISRYSDGVYTCVAKNRHGEARLSFTVKVYFSPEASVLTPRITKPTSQSVVMMCAVSGQPLFNTYWKDNRGQPITADTWKWTVHVEELPAYHMRFLTLVLHSGMWTTDDYGTYTCYAEGDGPGSYAEVLLEQPVEDADQHDDSSVATN